MAVPGPEKPLNKRLASSRNDAASRQGSDREAALHVQASRLKGAAVVLLRLSQLPVASPAGDHSTLWELG
jgi:hypothetical protein